LKNKFNTQLHNVSFCYKCRWTRE